MGWGGRRPGAGRKPQRKPSLAAVLNHPSVPTTNSPSPVEEFDAPDDLAADERAIWLKQAPCAFANGTLVKASALAFERYCKVAALERRMARTDDVGKAHHLGLLKHINTYELEFLLAPCGKPLAEPKPAVAPATSKLDRFRKGASA